MDEHEFQNKIEALESKNAGLQSQLDEAKSEVAVANCIKESMVELERRNSSLKSEVSTLQHLLQESVQDANSSRTRYEHDLARIKAVMSQLEGENRQLKQNEASNNDVDKDALVAFSDATKSLARKVKSAVTQLDPKSPSNEDNQLAEELQMRKAHEDSELLKSIVVPLEEQIGALKEKLREVDFLLVESEKRQSKTIIGIQSLADWLKNVNSLDQALQTLESKQKELLSFSELKSKDEGDASVSELHLALLTARVAILTSEISSARSELANQTEICNRTLNANDKLRHQAKLANDENARLKVRHLTEIQQMSDILTPDQKEKIQTGEAVFSETTPETSEEITISLSEWQKLNDALSKVRALLGVGVDEKLVGGDQFKQLQLKLQESQNKCENHAKIEEKLKEELKKESEFRKTVENEWNSRAELHKTETETLQTQLQQSEGLLEQLRVSFNANYKATRKDLQTLTADREKIVRELKRLQDENDNLVGKYSAKAEEMQNEVINLPEKMDDIHMLLLRYREDLITAKLAKERLEERLQSEVSFLKTQIAAEQQAKEQIEDHMSTENDQLKEKIFVLESCKSELEAEQKRSKEFEELQSKDRRANANLQRQMESHILEKRQMETKYSEMNARIKNLQQELDNSVAVQTDFVRLSQSLQVELEKIRQSEKEVRV